jgi:Ran GTPase-activating protein (RanGAP) involved in mRNA processing and transport
MVGATVQRHIDKLTQDTSVTCADFADQFFGDEGCIQLCDALAGSSTITELNLRGCNIRTGGATALAQFLQSNHTLRTLDLEWNGIGTLDKGVAVLSAALAANRGLTFLDLRNNGIGPAGRASADSCKPQPNFYATRTCGKQARVISPKH